VVLDHRFAAGDDTGDTGGVRERIAVGQASGLTRQPGTASAA
jgi:hypothetical protein